MQRIARHRGLAMAEHVATIAWQRDGATFIDDNYCRAHTWRFDGGLTIAASPSPHIVPAPMSVAENVDPEEAFVASISSCHMLFFLSICARRGFIVDNYSLEEIAKHMGYKNAQIAANTLSKCKKRLWGLLEEQKPSFEWIRKI